MSSKSKRIREKKLYLTNFRANRTWCWQSSKKQLFGPIKKIWGHYESSTICPKYVFYLNIGPKKYSVDDGPRFNNNNSANLKTRDFQPTICGTNDCIAFISIHRWPVSNELKRITTLTTTWLLLKSLRRLKILK